MMEWKTIDTADLTEHKDIIVSDGQKVFCAQYFEGRWLDMAYDPIEATHWHPLPAPPKDTQNA